MLVNNLSSTPNMKADFVIYHNTKLFPFPANNNTLDPALTKSLYSIFGPVFLGNPIFLSRYVCASTLCRTKLAFSLDCF